MIDRRQVITLLSTTALSATLLGRGAAAFVERSGRDDRRESDGRGAADDQLLYNLPLRLRGAQLAVTTIFLLGVSQLLILRTLPGVEQRSQNRANLGVVPWLGGLTQRTYGSRDFTTDNRIGAAYVEGTALFLYFYPELMFNPQARQLLFFNLLYSYALRDTVQTGNWQMLAALMPTFCAIETVRRTIEARLAPKALASPPPAGAMTGGATTALAPQEMDRMVMAGLVSDDGADKGGVPVLRDIPLLKSLFGGSVHRAAEDELLVLIRPSIVVGDNERT